jgi:hypothetical protein
VKLSVDSHHHPLSEFISPSLVYSMYLSPKLSHTDPEVGAPPTPPKNVHVSELYFCVGGMSLVTSFCVTLVKLSMDAALSLLTR